MKVKLRIDIKGDGRYGYADQEEVLKGLTDQEVAYIENQWGGFLLNTKARLAELRELNDLPKS